LPRKLSRHSLSDHPRGAGGIVFRKTSGIKGSWLGWR
jgi:hypothetical protein